LDRHHRLHHLFQYRNFNVVLPVADFLLGTLITRREQAQLKRVTASRRGTEAPPADFTPEGKSLTRMEDKNAF
jgi:sterol desaturase/sphingolipid hydroxylase (fatty acid hydroxylase superfamily)